MTNRSIAFFAMPQEGHFHTLRPLISGLTGRGVAAYVFTDRRFEAHVEREGGTFCDVFAKYPLERADGKSLPFPCRYVTFAGRYAEGILRDLEELRPSLVVYDAHAVIGRVVGAALGVPFVSVCPAHNASPDRVLPHLGTLSRIHISADCGRAVQTLRERYGVHDVSPFSFASALSPFLNVYGEPAPYLTDADRRAFEPVAFHGCLPSLEEIEAKRLARDGSYFAADATELKVYVSFGTVVWRYFPAEALAAVRVISESLAGMEDVQTVISLGGAELGADSIRSLTRPNVSVADYVDQWEVLQDADVFVTHNGLKSTHEAIFNGVPMVSYPFFWDQPALAERCRSFGLAIRLTESLRAPLTEDDVPAALAELSRRRESMRASLDEARDWELDVIADRDHVLQRITDLIQL